MTEQIYTPELRFPEFKEEWKLAKFKDIFIFHNNFRKPIKESLRVRGQYPYYGATGIIDYVDDFIFDGNYILIGEDGANIISRNAPLVYLSEGKFWVNNHAHILTPSSGDIHYLYQVAELVNYEKYNTGTAQPKLNIQNLKNISVNISMNLAEQEKIGTFFSKLDRQIELEEKKLELLEQQKKGYMQKIFSQELRFKDENGNDYPNWNKTLIKDIFEFENNRRKPITSSLREKGIYPYYGATGIIDYVKNYLFNNEERLLIGEDGAKWGQFESSSFIANGKYWVNNHAHVVKSNTDNLYFMNYYLNFKELRTFVTGNAPAKLTHANLCSINIKMPTRSEQDKISYLLKGIESKINKQLKKIGLLKQRKQGLLQKMFV